MNEFKIRAYGRMELAQLYSPELTDIAAYRKMKKWISLCPGLLQRLYDLGYESKRRSFTPQRAPRAGPSDCGCPGRALNNAPLYDA